LSIIYFVSKITEYDMFLSPKTMRFHAVRQKLGIILENKVVTKRQQYKTSTASQKKSLFRKDFNSLCSTYVSGKYVLYNIHTF
jgi:hypothetical protein